MKKIFIIASFTLVLTGLGSAVVAESSNAPGSQKVPDGQIALANASALHTTKINNIDVPFEVLTYAHTQHLGYAVIDAEKVKRGGADFYRLRLERDTGSNQYTNLYLFYSMNWELVDEKDIPKPKPKPSPEQQSDRPTPEQQQDEPDDDNEESAAQEDDKEETTDNQEKPEKPRAEDSSNNDVEPEQENDQEDKEEASSTNETETETTQETS